MRVVALLLGLLLILSGCTPVAERESPLDLAVRLHPGVIEATASTQLNLYLRSAEPTGYAPFAVLSAMHLQDPGQAAYTVSYLTSNGPDRRTNEYTWIVDEQTVTWTWIHTNGPHGEVGRTESVATGVDRARLSSLAGGEHESVAFSKVFSK